MDRQYSRVDPMQPILEAISAAGLKASYVLAAVFAALVAVLLDWKRYNFWTALLAIVSGVLVAVVATDPVVTVLHLPDTGNNAVAAALGIGGRNLIVFIHQVSKDPTKFMDRFRGRKD